MLRISLFFLGLLLTSKVAYAAQCSQEIGMAKAKELVNQCLQSSAATHPPCNVQNSCDMMREEIAHGCEEMKSSGGPVPKFCLSYSQNAGTVNPSVTSPSTSNTTSAAANTNNELILFITPSKNISCIYSGSDITCEITQFTPSFDNAYASIHGEDGNAGCDPRSLRRYSVSITSLTGDNYCPLLDFCVECNLTPLTIGYGSTFQKNGLTCLSEQKGLTCTNQLGHGFFLSKAKQSVF